MLCHTNQPSKNQQHISADGFPEGYNDQGSINVDENQEQRRQEGSQTGVMPERKVSDDVKETEKPNPEFVGKEADYASAGWTETEGE